MLPIEKLEALDNNRKANFVAMAVAFVAPLLIGLVALVFWLTTGPSIQVEAGVPGMDGRPDNLGMDEAPPDLAGIFKEFGGEAEDVPGDWTQFRGADATAVVTDGPELNVSWGESGPPQMWTVEVGQGAASPVVLDGRVYLLDYDEAFEDDEERGADALRCFSLETGEELWRRSYELFVKANHGMSRTIPAVTKDFIVTMGPRCHVVCLDTETGDFLWGKDLVREYGTTQPAWYTGQCPIIDDGIAVIAPSGEEVLMMGVDCATGETVWSVPNEGNWLMSHSSVVPMTIQGKAMYVYAGLGGIIGVSAEKEDLGTVLWNQFWDAKMVAPSPVKAGEDLIFLCGSYNKGSIMMRVTESGGTFQSEILYEKTPKDGLACEQQTPLFYNGHLYGVQKKEVGALKSQFACYDLDGNLVWSSGVDNRFGIGLGPFMMADEKFFVMDDEGHMTVLDATKGDYAPIAEAQVLFGHEAWGPIALAGDRMLVRDFNNLSCIDLSVK